MATAPVQSPEAAAFAALVPSTKNVEFHDPKAGMRPTPAQIDEIVDHYNEVLDEWELADERYEDCKNALIALVQRFGVVPVGAEKSLRLEGRVNILTVTTGSTTSLNEHAVVDLKSAMRANRHAQLFEAMFAERSRFERRKDASIALRTTKLSKRLIKLFNDLYVRCFDVRVKEPSLKIERIDAAKTKKAAKKGGK